MTDKAMDTLGFGEDDKAAVFRVLAALLHLGNVRFEVCVRLGVGVCAFACVLVCSSIRVLCVRVCVLLSLIHI